MANYIVKFHNAVSVELPKLRRVTSDASKALSRAYSAIGMGHDGQAIRLALIYKDGKLVVGVDNDGYYDVADQDYYLTRAGALELLGGKNE